MSFLNATEISRELEVSFPGLNATSRVLPLTEADRNDALAFLSERPLHTVIMAGWILDHGVISESHRGLYYGYRDAHGRLKGVALIGRNTLFEVRTEAALIPLARQASACGEINMIMGEPEKLATFWRHAKPNRSPRIVREELLYEIQPAVDIHVPSTPLRCATPDDLDLVAATHAAMVTQESGVNPLQSDRAGFRARCAARLDRGRIWIWREQDELIFKVDVLTQVPKISYIEGVWVNRAYRGRGICLRALKSLHQKLLRDTPVVCCFVEGANQAAHNLYLKAGYTQQGRYSKIYL